MQIRLSDEARMSPGPLMERLCFVERMFTPTTDVVLSFVESEFAPNADVAKKNRIRIAPHNLVFNGIIWPYFLSGT